MGGACLDEDEEELAFQICNHQLSEVSFTSKVYAFYSALPTKRQVINASVNSFCQRLYGQGTDLVKIYTYVRVSLPCLKSSVKALSTMLPSRN